MKIKLKKLYIVINNENTVVKAFEQNCEPSQIGKWYKKSVNFDEKTDFANAIIWEGKHFEDVEIGVTKYIIEGE